MMKKKKKVATTLVLCTMLACSLLTLTPASANEVWYQSIGRASAEATCPKLTADDLATGWTQWDASWKQWPNNNQGGFVCNREITWAFSQPPVSPFPSARCVPFNLHYLNFEGGYFLDYPDEDSLTVWSDSDCTTVSSLETNVLYIYAPAGFDALQLCATVIEINSDWAVARIPDSDVWSCYATG